MSDNKYIYESINNDDINKLPLKHYNGAIKIINNVEGVENMLEEIKEETIIGFDTETKPSFKKGVINMVSLLQLTTDNVTYLIRLNKTGLTDGLKKLLSNKFVLKVGVSVKDDMRGLKKLSDFKPGGFVEIQQMAQETGLKVISLKKLAALLLGFRVSKRQRLSNWEAENLSEGQQLYAATDSWVSLELFKKLAVINEGNIIKENIVLD